MMGNKPDWISMHPSSLDNFFGQEVSDFHALKMWKFYKHFRKEVK
jgi:hypothetical protein